VDPITHGLIGAALATAAGHPAQLSDPVFLGSTLGAMLPDLDIVAHLKGRLNYLLKHRGASHSLIALGGMAVGLSTVLYGLYPSTSWNTIFFWTLAGTLSHGIVDLLNSFGAELLWPFIRRKLTVDMIMLTDPVVFTLFLVALATAMYNPEAAQTASLAAFLFSGLYLGHRALGRKHLCDQLLQIYHLTDKKNIKVLPAMYRPFSWNFLILQDHLIRFGTVRRGKPEIRHVWPQYDSNDPAVAAALDGNVAEVFSRFTPYYHVVAETPQDGAGTVEFLDLRYWNKDDFLYTGRVMVNDSGEIARETFHSYRDEEGTVLSY